MSSTPSSAGPAQPTIYDDPNARGAHLAVRLTSASPSPKQRVGSIPLTILFFVLLTVLWLVLRAAVISNQPIVNLLLAYGCPALLAVLFVVSVANIVWNMRAVRQGGGTVVEVAKSTVARGEPIKAYVEHSGRKHAQAISVRCVCARVETRTVSREVNDSDGSSTHPESSTSTRTHILAQQPLLERKDIQITPEQPWHEMLEWTLPADWPLNTEGSGRDAVDPVGTYLQVTVKVAGAGDFDDKYDFVVA